MVVSSSSSESIDRKESDSDVTPHMVVSSRTEHMSMQTQEDTGQQMCCQQNGLSHQPTNNTQLRLHAGCSDLQTAQQMLLLLLLLLPARSLTLDRKRRWRKKLAASHALLQPTEGRRAQQHIGMCMGMHGRDMAIISAAAKGTCTAGMGPGIAAMGAGG
jgi:hypothetical protein